MVMVCVVMPEGRENAAHVVRNAAPRPGLGTTESGFRSDGWIGSHGKQIWFRRPGLGSTQSGLRSGGWSRSHGKQIWFRRPGLDSDPRCGGPPVAERPVLNSRVVRAAYGVHGGWDGDAG